MQPWEDYAKQGHDLDDNEGWELGFKTGGAKEWLCWENRYEKYSSSEESSDRSTESDKGDEENSESDTSAESESSDACVERKDREIGFPPFEVILQDLSLAWTPCIDEDKAEEATLLHKIDMADSVILY